MVVLAGVGLASQQMVTHVYKPLYFGNGLELFERAFGYIRECY